MKEPKRYKKLGYKKSDEEKVTIKRRIVIRTINKDPRGDRTGKVAFVYETKPSGEEELIFEDTGKQLKEAKRKLYRSGFVPNSVVIKKLGETKFEVPA
jgi:hypothetical protein